MFSVTLLNAWIHLINLNKLSTSHFTKVPESGRWIWRVRKKIGTRTSPLPPPDPPANPTSAATTQPGRDQDQHCRKESLLGAKCTQWKMLAMLPREPTRSQADHIQTVCIPSSDVTLAGRNTQLVVWSALTQMLCLRRTLRYYGA